MIEVYLKEAMAEDLEINFDLDTNDSKKESDWSVRISNPKVSYSIEEGTFDMTCDEFVVAGKITGKGIVSENSGAPETGPEDLIGIHVLRGTLMDSEGVRTLKPGLYILTGNTFAYGSPLGWAGHIVLSPHGTMPDEI